MLLKGLTDVGIAPDPHEAATMALLRLIHAADLPDPATLMAQLAGGGAVATAPARRALRASQRPRRPADFAGFIAAIERARQETARAPASRQCRAGVASRRAKLVLKALKPLGDRFRARPRARRPRKRPAQPWQIRLTDGEAAPSLQQQEAMAEEAARAAVMAEPSVQALLDAFPDATYLSHTRKEA